MSSRADRPVDSPEVLARVHAGLPYVDQLARRMRREIGAAATHDELVACGREGLLSAARTYDAARGVPFRSWAMLRARGAMIDGIRASGQLPRRLYKQLRALESADHVHVALVEEASASPPTSPESADGRLSTYLATMATAMAAGMLDVAGAGLDERDDGGSPEDRYARAELVARSKEAITRLPDGERALLEAHYFGDRTLEEAAASLGLSKSWGSRLHARAIEAVARDLKRAGIREP